MSLNQKDGLAYQRTQDHLVLKRKLTLALA
jgi:hypothetical protein